MPRWIYVGKATGRYYGRNILRILEGDLAPADCVVDEEYECAKEENCVTKLVWMQIRDSIDSVIDSITLKDMLDESKNHSK